jgi:hypothetical protein
MKFGVDLINFGPNAAPDSLARWAMLTETLGDHFLMTHDSGAYGRWFLLHAPVRSEN